MVGMAVLKDKGAVRKPAFQNNSRTKAGQGTDKERTAGLRA